MRLSWIESDTPAHEWTRIGSLLQGLDPDRDVLCFWQSSVADVGPDSGYCYKLVGLSEGSPRWLDFDIRQVWNAQSDQAGFSLERRLVREVSLSQQHPAGARLLRLREATAVSGPADGIGRWVRCQESQRAYVIASVVDDPAGDALFLADWRGIEEDLPAGAICHIDWGWSAGDLAFVMAPVHVTSTSRTGGEGFLDLRGDTTLDGVVLDGLGGSGYRGGLWQYGGRLHSAKHVWMMDPLTSNGQTVTLENVQCGARVEHMLITGGPEAPEADKNYGLAVMGGPSCTYYIDHLYTRHRGDDNLLTNSSGVSPTGTIVWQFVHGGPASVPGDSGQFLDFGTGNITNVYGSDGLCTACTSQDGMGSLIIPSGSGAGIIERLLWIGATGQGFSAAAVSVANRDFRYLDVGVIGSAVDPSHLGYGQLVGLDTERFYVRDISDPRAQSLQICVGSPFAAAARRLAKGLFLDVSLGGTPCTLVGDTELTEIALIDPARTGLGGPLIQVSTAVEGAHLGKITTAFSRPPVGIRHAVAFPSTISPSSVGIDRLLITGLDGEPEMAMDLRDPESAAGVDWGGPSCFAGVGAIDAPHVLAAYGAAPILLPDPGFGEVASLEVVPADGSAAAAADCGASTAGVATLDWAHRKMRLVPTAISRLLPECADGVDNDGDGFVDLQDPGCEDAGDRGELSPELPCDDGVDNDGDGGTDIYPLETADLGCLSPWHPEDPQCQDGIDNDGDGRVDRDGGTSLDLDGDGFVDARFNPATPAVGAPDPQCLLYASHEEPGCGFGFLEPLVLMPMIASVANRRGARRKRLLT